jgi:acetoin utilization protein AcuC
VSPVQNGAIMTPAKYVFIHSGEIERFHYPPTCPFKTERASLTRSILIAANSFAGDDRLEISPRALTEEELFLFHTPEYVERLKRVSLGAMDSTDLFAGLGTDDCPVFADLYNYGVLAAGATVVGARYLLDNAGARLAFNPSGGYHHAYADKAGGFCYINDVVLGCRVLTGAGKRVFCLDLDVHHGNGTQAAFYDDPGVFTVSLHESGKTLFPWAGFEDKIGEGGGKGYNVNLPFPAGTDDDIYCAAFKEIVPPLIYSYSPDVIVLETGMDVLSVDPLAHLKMTNNAFAELMPLLMRFDVPILMVGGGGYNPQATARGWALLWTILCGIEPESDMSIGMGGDFLGNSEWNAGLHDMRIYAGPEDRVHITQEVARSVDRIRRLVFPIHGIA